MIRIHHALLGHFNYVSEESDSRIKISTDQSGTDFVLVDLGTYAIEEQGHVSGLRKEVNEMLQRAQESVMPSAIAKCC